MQRAHSVCVCVCVCVCLGVEQEGIQGVKYLHRAEDRPGKKVRH